MNVKYIHDNETKPQHFDNLRFQNILPLLSYLCFCQVFVVPYIPSELRPRNLDYVVQNMQFDNINKLKDVKDDIGKKLTEVYVRAQLNGPRKRKRRALGSIEAVVSTR